MTGPRPQRRAGARVPVPLTPQALSKVSQQRNTEAVLKLDLVFVSQGSHNKVLQAGWLRSRKYSLEAGSLKSRGQQGGFLRGLSPCLVNSHLLPVSSSGLLSLSVFYLLSYKDTSWIRAHH